jgi:thioredoxin 1
MSEQPKTFQELIDGDTPVLVDFFATWCGPCKMMQPILEDTSKTLGDKVKIVKVDVDKNPLAATKFQVRGVPTLILFQNGKILWRESGVVPAHQLVKTIKNNTLVKA